MATTMRPGQRLGRYLSGLLALVGFVAAFAGVAYAINGATQGQTQVTVPVRVDSTADTEFSWGMDQVRLDVGGLPEGSWVFALGNDLELSSTWGSSRWEHVLARGDALVLGLAIGSGALLVRQVVGSVADGRPFDRRNARCLVWLAVIVAVAGWVGPWLPSVAAEMVLARMGVGAAQGVLPRWSGDPGWWPALVSLVLLVLAQAFRQGERLTRDVEGLV